MLFSGSRFPLEMLSSMGFHISSFSWSLLPGLFPAPLLGKPVVRRDALAIAEELRGFRAAGGWGDGGMGDERLGGPTGGALRRRWQVGQSRAARNGQGSGVGRRKRGAVPWEL